MSAYYQYNKAKDEDTVTRMQGSNKDHNIVTMNPTFINMSGIQICDIRQEKSSYFQRDVHFVVFC